jgi:hypothetical protein
VFFFSFFLSHRWSGSAKKILSNNLFGGLFMKFLLPLVAVALLSAAPAKADSALVSLDCVTNTGVVIKSTGDAADGLAVDSKWGLFERKFTARTGATVLGNTTYIELAGDHGVEYYIALQIKKDVTEVQKLSGALLQPSAVEGLPPTVVGAVQCDVTVK